jgi:AraC-like DNA-binding protein
MGEDIVIPKNRDICAKRFPRYMPPNKHKHDFIEIQYVLSLKPGTVQLISDNTEMKLDVGDIIVLSPGVDHCLSLNDDQEVVYSIAVRKSTFQSAQSILLKLNNKLSEFFIRAVYNMENMPFLVYKSRGDAKIYNTVMNICNEDGSDMLLSEQLQNSYFQQLCIQLMRLPHRDLYSDLYSLDIYSGKQLKNNIRTIDIIQYVTQHCRTITLDELSHKFNYSKEHLSRHIKKLTGKTFTSIRDLAKIHIVADLILASKDLNIETVAEILGFADSSQVYRLFKKQYGMTPSKFRKFYSLKQ